MAFKQCQSYSSIKSILIAFERKVTLIAFEHNPILIAFEQKTILISYEHIQTQINIISI